jgi:RND superfamily putative drug exporter
LERLSGQLTRMKVIPNHKNPATASAVPASGVAVLEREPAPTDYLSGHALPLFDLGGMADRFTDDLRKLARHSPSTSNANRPADRYLGHSLPLFGFDFKSHRPTKLKTNGNNHTKKTDTRAEVPVEKPTNGGGRVNAEQPADYYASSLPLFGPNTVSRESNGSSDNGASHVNGSSGGSSGGSSDYHANDADLGQSLPLFSPRP